MSTPIARTRAKRLAWVFQFGAAACVAGAVALWILGIPGLASPSSLLEVASGAEKDADNTPRVGTPGSDTIDERVRTDPGSIAARLALVDNAPAPAPTEEDPVDDDAASADPDEGSSADQPGMAIKRVRYLGYIREGSDRLAFLRFDGDQRIVRQGAVMTSKDPDDPDMELVSVAPGFVIVDDGNGRQRVELASKSGAAVTMVDGSGGEIQRQPTTLAEVQLTEEELERLSKLPPRQRALQERILKRRKLGNPPENIPVRDKEPVARINSNFSSGAVQRRERATGRRDQDTRENERD